jgi:hypothetical protein
LRLAVNNKSVSDRRIRGTRAEHESRLPYLY